MGTPATILLVEDDESLQEGIRDLLEIADIGYEINVITAPEGHEGLAAMRTFTPDLIISDIMMPNMDGFEFLTAVRDEPHWVHVPFIFLTAKGKKQDIFKGKLSGAELYITKPFDTTELLDLVKTQLRRSFERQAAQQENLQNFKRNILQLLNHEFRTPLTYVTAYYEMLVDSLAVYEDTENLEAYLTGIHAGCARLSNLIDDLILVMDIRTGEVQKTFQQEARVIYNLAELFREAGESIEELVEGSKDIKFRYEIPVPLPATFGIPRYLTTVFTHLLRNAVKFLAYKLNGNKEIVLSAKTSDRRIILQITDNGIGIPAAVQEQIFELFYQYNRDYFEQQGSGSGLTISKGLIETHHGHIAVQSAENKGSTFTISLPVYVPGHTVTADESSSKPTAHIIVVEDDYYLLDGLQELLELYEGPYRLTVETAEDGVKGLEAVNRRQPDLIISDIMMPNMDGFEFLKHVRSRSEWLHIPFIFLTAKGDPMDVHKGRQSGVEEYITKPYDSEELLSLVTIQLNRYYQLLNIAHEGFDSLKQSILGLLQPDLRNPINTVANQSENLSTLLQEAKTPESFKQTLRVIQQGSNQISELVEDFITLAEIKTGEAQHAFNMRARPVPNSGMLLQMAAQEFEGEAFKNNVMLDSSKAGKKLPPVEIDYDNFFNALKRLVSAVLEIAYENRATTVHLAAGETENSVNLIVWHDGQPLPQELREKVELLFTSGNENTIIGQGSFGPQLCIVQGLATINQGKALLRQNENKRDLFIISLPIYREQANIKV